MAKAQVSVEILSYYILLSGIFLATLILIVYNQRSVDDERILMDARKLLVLAKNEIDTAVNVGSGYSHSFFLPGALHSGINYTMSVQADEQAIYISYSGRNISLPMLASSITGSIHEGNNIIRNSGGVIYLE